MTVPVRVFMYWYSLVTVNPRGVLLLITKPRACSKVIIILEGSLASRQEINVLVFLAKDIVSCSWILEVLILSEKTTRDTSWC